MSFLKKKRGLFIFFIALILPGFGNAVIGDAPRLDHFASYAWASNINDNDDYFSDDPFAEPSVLTHDPLEKFNRAMFTFNDRLYFWFLKPVSVAYGTVTPPGFRACIRNAFDNLFFPIRFVNNTLQGKFKGASVEMGRFLINSTLGVGGFFDLAARDFNLHPHEEDFGQTLGYYGIQPHVYIVWPILGPSTVRDTFGKGGDFLLNPIGYLSYIGPGLWETMAIRTGERVNATSLRIGEYEDFKASAVDPYVSLRDVYLNYRARQIAK